MQKQESKTTTSPGKSPPQKIQKQATKTETSPGKSPPQKAQKLEPMNE